MNEDSVPPPTGTSTMRRHDQSVVYWFLIHLQNRHFVWCDSLLLQSLVDRYTAIPWFARDMVHKHFARLATFLFKL